MKNSTDMQKANYRFFCLPHSNKSFRFKLSFYNIPRERQKKSEWEKDIENVKPVYIKSFDLDRKSYSDYEVLPGKSISIWLDDKLSSIDSQCTDQNSSNICKIVSLETNNSFPQDAILTVQKNNLQVKATVLIDSFVGVDASAIEGSLLVLAHKLICRKDLLCDFFACCPASTSQLNNQVTYDWTIVNCLGESIAQGHIESKLGNYIHININELIKEHHFNQLLTLKMTSNYKNQIVFTVLHNDVSIAIEHSLPPVYYLGDKDMLDASRDYAFGFHQK